MEDCKQNILILIPTLEIGGAETQALKFSIFLKKKGFNVWVASFADKGPIKDELVKNNIQFIQFKNPQIFFRFILKIYRVFDKFIFKSKVCYSYLLYPFTISVFLYNEKIDYAISYCGPCNTCLGISKKFYHGKCRFVWFQRDAGIYNLDGLAQGYAASKMDIFLSNSYSGKKFLLDTYGKESHIIYNGVKLVKNKDKINNWYDKLSVSLDTTIVTMVANLSSAKNHLLLLRAWKVLTENYKAEKSVLILAGRFDDKYQEIKEFVEINHLNDSVQILGLVDDVQGLLEITDIFAFTAISEGTSNSIVEACLSKLPIVATDLPEIRDIVSVENIDYLSKNDENEFCLKLYELMKNKNLRTVLGNSNFAKAVDKFDENKNFTQIIDIIGAES